MIQNQRFALYPTRVNRKLQSDDNMYISTFRIQLVCMKMRPFPLMSRTIQGAVRELLSSVWSHHRPLSRLLFLPARCPLVQPLPPSHTLVKEALTKSLTPMLKQLLTPCSQKSPAPVTFLLHTLTAQTVSLLTLWSLGPLHSLSPLCQLLHFHPG